MTTEDASAQRDAITKADLVAANARASAAINIGKRVWNLLGIYVAEDGELVGAKSGPITQSRGVGGGIPATLVQNGGQGPTGPPGPQGAAGATGSTGPEGQIGPPGLSGFEMVTETSATNSSPQKSVFATCPPGKTIIGGVVSHGGVVANVVASATAVNNSLITGTGQEVWPYQDMSWNVSVTVYCAIVET